MNSARQALPFALSALTLVLSAAAQGQTPEMSRAPIAAKPLQICGAGLAPQLSVSVLGVYVRLAWQAVPGGRSYTVYRVAVAPPPLQIGGSPPTPTNVGQPTTLTQPGFAGIPESAGSGNLFFVDAPPDIGAGHYYRYTVIAGQPNGCTGMASSAVIGPLSAAPMTRLVAARLSAVNGTLSWQAPYGALSFRISGDGIPAPGVVVQVGTFTEGGGPALALAVVNYGLVYKSGSFTFPIPTPAAATGNYTVVPVYPYGFLGQPMTQSLPVVTCHFGDVTPSSGLSGAIVSISGDHLERASVKLGPEVITPLTIAVGGGPSGADLSSLTIQIPDMSHYLLPQAMQMSVRSTWGDCGAPRSFMVSLPAKVRVPALVNNSVQKAAQILQQAHLLLGSVTAGAKSPGAIVQTQDRQPGALVDPGAVVNVSTTTLTTIPPGLGSLQLTNNLQSAHSVYLWLYDYGTGQFSPQNGKDLLASRASASVSLPANHFSGIYVVDPQNPQCAGRNDPTDTGACVVWETVFFGGQNGPAVAVPIQ